MKRNYNGVNKGKVIPLTEVKPGMVFRIVSDKLLPVVGWLFWCDGDGVFCTDTDATSQVPVPGCAGHDHWLGTASWNNALVVNSLDKRAIQCSASK
jgi:hypothetical protein